MSITSRSSYLTEKRYLLEKKNCPYCGQPFDKSVGVARFSWQHVLPKRRGGKNNSENLKPCCNGCNTDMSIPLVDDCPGALAAWRSRLDSSRGYLSKDLANSDVDYKHLTGKAKRYARTLLR